VHSAETLARHDAVGGLNRGAAFGESAAMGARRRLLVALVALVAAAVVVAAILALVSSSSGDNTTSVTTSSFSLATTPPPTTFVGGPRRWCDLARPPVAVGALQGRALREVSGAVVSRRHAGVLWIHNDSGDRARVFAIDTSGNVLAEVRLSNVVANDWEDITILPGSGGAPDTIVVADIGDNLAQRTSVQLIRFAEPELPADPTVPLVIDEALAETFVYDQPHDAEAVFADPLSRKVFLVTKEFVDPPQLFLAGPALGDDTRRLQQLGAVEVPLAQLVTAADAAADGAAILLRTSDEVLVYERLANETMAATFAREPCRAPVPLEPQGEALAIAPDGSGFYLIGEGRSATIWFVGV
jgi:hypothetical protein